MRRMHDVLHLRVPRNTASIFRDKVSVSLEERPNKVILGDRDVSPTEDFTNRSGDATLPIDKCAIAVERECCDIPLNDQIEV